MGRDIFSLVKHTSIYTVGVILSKLVGFVMIPLYTRMLTPADYGVLELMSMTTDVIALLVGLGLSSAVMRHYYAYDDGPGHIPGHGANTSTLQVARPPPRRRRAVRSRGSAPLPVQRGAPQRYCGPRGFVSDRGRARRTDGAADRGGEPELTSWRWRTCTPQVPRRP